MGVERRRGGGRSSRRKEVEVGRCGRAGSKARAREMSLWPAPYASTVSAVVWGLVGTHWVELERNVGRR